MPVVSTPVTKRPSRARSRASTAVQASSSEIGRLSFTATGLSPPRAVARLAICSTPFDVREEAADRRIMRVDGGDFGPGEQLADPGIGLARQRQQAALQHAFGVEAA